jgi:hypothetical protein
MSKTPKGFREGRKGDSDENEGHVRPIDKTTHIEAPAGQYVDVPRGMLAVPDTKVDENGILRRETGELAIWHHRCKTGGHGPCERYTDHSRFVQLEEVVYIDGAPWCPDCVEKMKDDDKRKNLQELFRVQAEEN